MRLAALAAFSMLATLGGCGGDDGGGGGDVPPIAVTALELTLDSDGSGPRQPRHAEVECGAGPADDPVCAAVEPLEAADLEPVPEGTICTEIYGGPDVVEIEGTLRGEAVEARLTRENGCEIARFDRVRPLLDELFPGYRPGASLRP